MNLRAQRFTGYYLFIVIGWPDPNQAEQ